MFITFEGIEGCGKSTQSRMLYDHLYQSNLPVLLTREPGGCALGQRLRSLLLSRDGAGLTAHSELFLYLADRAQHVGEVIRPALQQGRVVLCDRFTDSTVAYQGYGRGLDVTLLNTLNTIAVDGCLPDLTFVLDLPVEVGLGRARARNDQSGQNVSEGRFEAEDLVFHRRVREGYLALAAASPRRFLVQADGAPTEVFNRIWSLVGPKLGCNSA